MRPNQKRVFFIIIVASLSLFVVNNVLFTKFVTSIPGGSAMGVTTIFTVVLLSLIIRRFGSIFLVYLIYGFVGAISHLIAGDWVYLLTVVLLVASAAVFDWVLYKSKYRFLSYLLAFPLFVALCELVRILISYIGSGQLPTTSAFEVIIILLVGYVTIVFAYVCYSIVQLVKEDRA